MVPETVNTPMISRSTFTPATRLARRSLPSAITSRPTRVYEMTSAARPNPASATKLRSEKIVRIGSFMASATSMLAYGMLRLAVST